MIIDKSKIKTCGCAGQRLKVELTVTADADTTNLEILCDDSFVDIYAVRSWWQHGRSIAAQGKYLNEELLLKDPMLVTTVGTDSYLRDALDDVHDITDEGATLPSDLEVYDASTLQAATLNAGDSQKYYIIITIPGDATESFETVISVIANGQTQNIPVVIELLPFVLLSPSQLTGMYYTQCLIDDPAPPLSSRHYVSEARMLAELQLMHEIGINYPSWYAEGTGKVSAMVALRNSIELPIDKVFWTTIRSDTGPIEELPAKCVEVLALIPGSDPYFYGIEEVPEQAEQIPRWDIIRANGCYVWNAMAPAQVNSVVGHIDLVNISGANNIPAVGEYPAAIIAGGGEASCYSCPQLGQDVEQWAIRRNYGWLAWSYGYNAIFPYVLRDHSDVQNSWLDWSGDSDYRPIVVAYPTTDGCIRTLQAEYLGEAITDLRYITTLEAAIENAPPSKSVQQQAAENWLSKMHTTAPLISGSVAMDQRRLICLHHILELT